MPSTTDYSAVLGTPPGRRPFGEDLSWLQHATFESQNPLYPHWDAGNFAIIAKATTAGGTFAIRCPLAPSAPDIIARQKALEEHLATVSKPWPGIINQRLYSPGVYVAREWQPVFVMDWVTGHTLDVKVSQLIASQRYAEIAAIADQVEAIIVRLQEVGISHGDIQHGNIMVIADNKVVLVDYDTMLVPASEHLSLVALGLAGYAHPRLFEGALPPNVRYRDTFPCLVILMSLRAICEHPELYGSSSKENLLLSVQDLVGGRASAIFQTLQASQDRGVRTLTEIVLCLLDDFAEAFTPLVNLLPVRPRFPVYKPELVTPPPIPKKAAQRFVRPIVPLPNLPAPPTIMMTPGQNQPTPATPMHKLQRRKGGPLARSYPGTFLALSEALISTLPVFVFIGLVFYAPQLRPVQNLLFEVPPEARFILIVLLAPYLVIRLSSVLTSFWRLFLDARAATGARKKSEAAGSDLLEQCKVFESISETCHLRILAESAINARHLQSFDMSAALESAAAQEDSKSPLQVANHFLVIGLLGTVFGLGGVVSTIKIQIDGALTSSSRDNLMRGLNEAVAQMGSAFGATAWGISAALLYTVIYVVLCKQRAALVEANERFILNELVPSLWPKAPAAVFAELDSILQRMVSHSAVVESTIRSTSYDLDTRLKAVVNHLDKVLRDAGKYSSDAVDALSSATSELQKVFTGNIMPASTDLALTASTLRADFTELAKAAGQVADSLDSHGRDLTKVGTAISEGATMATKAIGEAGTKGREDAIALATQITKRLDDHSKTVSDSLITLAQAVEAAASSSRPKPEDIARLVDLIGEAKSLVEASQKRNAAELGTLAIQVDALVSRMSTQNSDSRARDGA